MPKLHVLHVYLSDQGGLDIIAFKGYTYIFIWTGRPLWVTYIIMYLNEEYINHAFKSYMSI